VVEKVGMDTESSYNIYPQFEIFEKARQKFIKVLKGEAHE